MVVFAMSGSLREGSSNTEILNLLKPLVPKGTEYLIYQGLEKLPHYNPDFDQDNEPSTVKEMRGMIARSNMVIISTPEYAHGIPGSLKNALDWLVSTTVLEKKPIGLIFGSTSLSLFAQDALVEVLKTMNGNIIPDAVINIPGIRAKIEDNSITEELKKFMDHMISGTVLKS
jgi:chromate reductase